jgi:hypothetical protein
MSAYRIALGLLLAATLSCALTAPAGAVPRAFVSASGDDGGSGSDPNNPETILNPKTSCGPVSPCRTIGKALTVVDDGGEVVLASSGDYEPFSIRKSASIVAAPGVHAVITATSGSAITIDAGHGTVALHGLTLNGRGGETGINLVSVGKLHVKHFVLDGFNGNAIALNSSSGTPSTQIDDTTVRNSGGCCSSAVYSGVAGGVSINRLRMHHNRHGLVADYGPVAIRDSVATGQIVHGIWARGLLYDVFLTIENCTVMGTESGSGIIAGDPAGPHEPIRVFVSNSTVTSNATGISAHPSTNKTSVWVSNTTIALNNSGIVHSDGTDVLSRGDNTLEGNADNGSFTWGFSAK